MLQVCADLGDEEGQIMLTVRHRDTISMRAAVQATLEDLRMVRPRHL